MPLRQIFPATQSNEADGAGSGNGAVDIVAIHGLNPFGNEGHAFATWSAQPDDEKGHLWLRDDVPLLIPAARVFIYEYNSFPILTESKTRFVHEANALLECIDTERFGHERRPIILIGHSLGGILIKQALVNATSNPHYQNIVQSTRGLLFFGTPHTGGKDALVRLGKIAVAIVNLFSWSPQNDIMEALQTGSLYSDTLEENWKHQLCNYRIVSFYEGIGDIVSRESASFGLPGDIENVVRLNSDHRNMCRFNPAEQTDVDNYKHVRHNLRRLYCDIIGSTQLGSAKPLRGSSNSLAIADQGARLSSSLA